MQNAICMQILQPKTHLKEKLPDLTFTELSAPLSFKILAKITIFAELHHNVESIASLKKVMEGHDMHIIEFFHQHGFAQRLLLLLPGHVSKVDLFNNVFIAVFFRNDAVYNAERALAQLRFELILC